MVAEEVTIYCTEFPRQKKKKKENRKTCGVNMMCVYGVSMQCMYKFPNTQINAKMGILKEFSTKKVSRVCSSNISLHIISYHITQIEYHIHIMTSYVYYPC